MTVMRGRPETSARALLRDVDRTEEKTRATTSVMYTGRDFTPHCFVLTHPKQHMPDKHTPMKRKDVHTSDSGALSNSRIS
mmetsp:Transcript_15089/g.22815  ORF Transcript_15089/g.22815 Transcript_15089/m.22815 type:complete len:80 (+) Transcript_15089:1476-1715(+)